MNGEILDHAQDNAQQVNKEEVRHVEGERHAAEHGRMCLMAPVMRSANKHKMDAGPRVIKR
jgi:hypothetical protein